MVGHQLAVGHFVVSGVVGDDGQILHAFGNQSVDNLDGADILWRRRVITIISLTSRQNITASTARLWAKNRTPLCASETSPGLGILPPPIKAISDIVW